jgi:hypothetical protein
VADVAAGALDDVVAVGRGSLAGDAASVLVAASAST